jgi:ATP-dependent Clp protease adaptor protein ClpS
LTASRQVFRENFLIRLEKVALIVNYAFKKKVTIQIMATQFQNESVVELERSKSRPPSVYKVFLLNDDFTTMEFVIEVLQKFFAKNAEQATQIMLKVHHEGSAVCGIYSKDIAETKVAQVTEHSMQHGHPLRCQMEETQ